jgi:hypothetical protein
MQTTLIILVTVFLILSIVIVLGVFAIAVLLLLRALRTKRDDKKYPETDLEVVDLSQELTERAHKVTRHLMPKDQWKKVTKKRNGNSYESTVFVSRLSSKAESS